MMKESLLRIIKARGTATYADFAGLGDRRAVGVYLGFLVKEGLVERASRGVYRLKGEVAPEFEVVFGLEIEAEYNKELLKTVKVAGYHDSEVHPLCRGWRAENDGSLQRYGAFPVAGTFELISEPTIYSELSARLDMLQKSIDHRAGRKTRLNEVLSFNNTTGAHIHIGILKRGRAHTLGLRSGAVSVPGLLCDPKAFVGLDFVRKVARLVRARVKRDLPAFYPLFVRDYYRRYAKRPTVKNIVRDRYLEWNYQSNYKTIEYRSPHLHGITTWEDFRRFYMIVAEAIQEAFSKELSRETPFSKTETVACESRVETVSNVTVEDEITIMTGERNVQY